MQSCEWIMAVITFSHLLPIFSCSCILKSPVPFVFVRFQKLSRIVYFCADFKTWTLVNDSPDKD